MSRRLWLALVALAIVANVAKFVHLDADFPAGLTTSRALYTDEGWYSSNAVNAATGKPWYTPGAWNTAINLPVGPLLQTVAFRLFGTNLISARGLVATASIVLIGAAFVTTRRYLSIRWALLLAVMLSLDFFLFGYARLAILDLMMTTIVMLAFAVAASLGVMPLLAATLAGALLGLATLAKTTALCALPALIYFCSARRGAPTITPEDDRRSRRRTAALVVIAAGIVIVGYNAAAWHAFPSDYLTFHTLAEGEGLARGPLDLLRNFVVAIVNMVRAEPVLVAVAVASIVMLSRRSVALRANVFVHTSLIWLLTFLVMLSLRSYQPSRYFVVVVVPLYVLLCAGLEGLADLSVPAWAGYIMRAVAVGGLLALNTVRIANYLAHPSYSFVNMARAVAGIVNQRSNGGRPGVLIGDMAPTLSIERRINAISLGHATWPLPTQIAQRCPTHFITLESQDGSGVHDLSEYYAVQPAGEWDVLGNYYEGRPVRLFTLSPRAGTAGVCGL